MEVVVAVLSGTPLCALRVQLKRRVSTRPQRRGDYNEVPQAIQKMSRLSPGNCVTPFACKLLSEKVFGSRKANVIECRVFASFLGHTISYRYVLGSYLVLVDPFQKPEIGEKEEKEEEKKGEKN
jgi:hypothetical protein